MDRRGFFGAATALVAGLFGIGKEKAKGFSGICLDCGGPNHALGTPCGTINETDSLKVISHVVYPEPPFIYPNGKATQKMSGIITLNQNCHFLSDEGWPLLRKTVPQPINGWRRYVSEVSQDPRKPTWYYCFRDEEF